MACNWLADCGVRDALTSLQSLYHHLTRPDTTRHPQVLWSLHHEHVFVFHVCTGVAPCDQLDSAEETLSTALAWNPGHAEANYNLGILCLCANPARFDEALKHFRIASSTRPGFAAAIHGAAEVSGVSAGDCLDAPVCVCVCLCVCVFVCVVTDSRRQNCSVDD